MIETFLVGHGQKWVWPIWSLSSKIDCISRKNWWNWFFACWYNFTQINRWFKIFVVSMVKNGCGQSGDGTLTLTLSEEWADGINWFFSSWSMITKSKSWSKIFRMGIVKNGCSQSGYWTQKWTDERKFDSGNLKVDWSIFGWAWSKMAMAF